MKKIAILMLFLGALALSAQRAPEDNLRQREIRDLPDFDPFLYHCSKYEVKRYLRYFGHEEPVQQKTHLDDSGALQLQSSQSQWVPIGPEGGDIRGISPNPVNSNEIYAASYGYLAPVFKTVNSGQTWEKIASIDSSVYDISVDPTNPSIIYAPSYSIMNKSEDGGTSWQKYSFCSGFYCSSYRRCIEINPDNSNIIYIAGYYYESNLYGMAVLKSTDGGKNWTGKKITSAFNWAYTESIAIDPSNPNILYAGGYYYDGSTSYYKVYKTIDAGNSWSDITGIILGPPESILIDPRNPSKVYVGTGWGIFRSSDGGQTWQKNNGYAYAYALAIDPSDSNILYAGYYKSCYKSIDGGVNWTSYSGSLYGSCNKLIACSASSTRLFYASNAGIYKSVDSGVTWGASHTGIKANRIPALAVAPSSPNIIYIEVANNGFFKSSDSGNSWERLPDFYRCDAITKIIINPNKANDIFILAGG